MIQIKTRPRASLIPHLLERTCVVLGVSLQEKTGPVLKTLREYLEALSPGRCVGNKINFEELKPQKS